MRRLSNVSNDYIARFSPVSVVVSESPRLQKVLLSIPTTTAHDPPGAPPTATATATHQQNSQPASLTIPRSVPARRRSTSIIPSTFSPSIISVKDPNTVEVDVLKKRLDEAITSNNNLKKENTDLKQKLSQSLTPEQINRLKNDNKRLLGLTERINSQRAMMEERFKEKKEEIEELEKELANKKTEIEVVREEKEKVNEVVESLLLDIEKLREEIKVLRDGKSFADFVELKRQINELKHKNVVLTQGLNSNRKGSLYFNLNDLAIMLQLKEERTFEAISQRVQNQRIVVLDERELEESIRKEDEEGKDGSLPCCRESPTQSAPHRTIVSRQSSAVNRINYISPPRSLATSPRVFSRQSSRDRTHASWNGTVATAHPGSKRQHSIIKRRSSPRWPSLSELNERYQSALNGAWTRKPSIDEVSEYIKNQHNTRGAEKYN